MTRLDAILAKQHPLPLGDEMYLADIAVQAKAVREAQRKYFQSRSQSDLIAAKTVENALDHLLAQEAA